MGYKVQSTIFRLKFADEKYEGLEVRIKSPNMGVFLDITSMSSLDITKVTPENIEATNKVFGLFADSVLDWNLEDDAGPIPHSVKGLRQLDVDFVMDMIQAWVEALQGASPGLPQPSGDGQPSLEASIPMEELSQSQANWRERVSS